MLLLVLNSQFNAIVGLILQVGPTVRIGFIAPLFEILVSHSILLPTRIRLPFPEKVIIAHLG